MGFGIGIGAFMDGVRQGAGTASFIKGAIKDRQVQKMEKQAFDETAAARDADIAKGVVASTDAAGVTSYGVGDQSFADAAEARKAAEAKVGSFMDYYRTNTAPKLIEGYMRAGQADRANQLQTYLDSQDGKTRFKQWASASQRFAMGDHAGGFQRLASLYKHVDDGVDVVDYSPITEDEYEERTLPGSKETVRVPTGRQRETGGWRVNWKDKTSGKVFSQDYDTADDFARTALYATSPEYQAQYALADLKAAQSARAEAAKKSREYTYERAGKREDALIADARDERNFKRDVARDKVKDGFDRQRDATRHGYDMERDSVQHGQEMERDNNSVMMKSAYKLSDETKEAPEDVRKALDQITQRLATNDLKFNSLTPDEQAAKAESIYRSQRTRARGILGKDERPTGRGAVPTLY